MDNRFFKPVNNDSTISNVIVNIVQSIDPVVEINSIPLKEGAIEGYDLLTFIDDIYDFLKEFQTRTDMFKDFSLKPGNTYETLSEDESNALRYNIVNRTPATTEQGKKQHTGRKMYRWMLRDIVEDKKHPGYKVLVYTKTWDNTFDLVSWSKNYRDADKAIWELEDLFSTYIYLFRLKGLLEFRLEGRKEDLFREHSHQSWYGCPIEIYARTYETKLVYEKTLEEIAIEIITNSQ